MSDRLHRSEVNRQIGRLNRAARVPLTRRQIEAKLGYPLAEASRDQVRAIWSTLEAVYEAAVPDA